MNDFASSLLGARASKDVAGLNAMLARYADLVDRESALDLRLGERLTELKDADDTYCRLREEANGVYGERATITLKLAEMHADRDPRHQSQYDSGRVLITWPRARQTWKLSQPASWYATDEAPLSLLEVFRPLVASANPYKLVEAVIDWLNPMPKIGELPDPVITVRPLKDGVK